MRMGVHNLLSGHESRGSVLVTGHTGFKGAWLTMLLHKLGFEVVGLSLPPEENSLYLSLNQSNRPTTEYFEDIRNREKIEDVLSRHSFIYAFHLAAQPLVLESYESPVETFETNVLGAANVLSALVKQKALIAIGVVTTDKVYRNSNLATRFTESDQLGGKDPYSASKVGTEAVADAWRQISKLNDGPRIISLRAGNVIGGGDFSKDRLLPDIIRSITAGTPLTIRSPKSTRPWQHVLDPLIGYFLALASSEDHDLDSFNFGPIEASLSVSTVIKIAREYLDGNLAVEITETSNDIEAKSLELDSSRSLSTLKWKPFLSQEEAIIKTLDWWRLQKQDSGSASSLCNDEISLALNSYK